MAVEGGGNMRGAIVTFKLARRLRRDMSLPEIVL